MRIKHQLAAAPGPPAPSSGRAAGRSGRRRAAQDDRLYERSMINTDGDQRTSSERRPDDPAYGLDPVVHVRLGVGHEQEGLMADWCAVLLSGSTCGDGRETGETRGGVNPAGSLML